MFIKTSLYVLTEGVTEVSYFGRIKEIVNADKEGKFSVNVDIRHIADGLRTDPKGLVKEAKDYKKDYDEVWIVFDKDRSRDDQLIAAFTEAKKAKINVAFSSIAFEHWLLLHFERSNNPFERSDCESRGVVCTCNGQTCVTAYLRQPGYYPSFKKGYSKLYDDLEAKTVIGIENSAWLRLNKSPYVEIHGLNPYTDVDYLVCKLLNLKRVFYGRLNTPLNFIGLAITLQQVARNGDHVNISLLIKNNGDVGFPMNNNQEFVLLDENGNEYAYTTNSLVINPDDQSTVALNFSMGLDITPTTLKLNTYESYYLIDLT